jgi:hypothetical protein
MQGPYPPRLTGARLGHVSFRATEGQDDGYLFYDTNDHATGPTGS